MTETKSLFWKNERTLVKSTDENGKPAQGCRSYKTPDGREVICRFKNGYLDGDSVLADGKFVVQPAVEGEGHIEYWRAGKLHRDGGLAAVATDGYSVKEYWENNRRTK